MISDRIAEIQAAQRWTDAYLLNMIVKLLDETDQLHVVYSHLIRQARLERAKFKIGQEVWWNDPDQERAGHYTIADLIDSGIYLADSVCGNHLGIEVYEDELQ